MLRFRPKNRSELGAQDRKIHRLPLLSLKTVKLQFTRDMCTIWPNMLAFLDTFSPLQTWTARPLLRERPHPRVREWYDSGGDFQHVLRRGFPWSNCLRQEGRPYQPFQTGRSLPKALSASPREQRGGLNIPNTSKTRFYKLLAARTLISLLVGVIKVKYLDNAAV